MVDSPLPVVRDALLVVAPELVRVALVAHALGLVRVVAAVIVAVAYINSAINARTRIGSIQVPK